MRLQAPQSAPSVRTSSNQHLKTFVTRWACCFGGCNGQLSASMPFCLRSFLDGYTEDDGADYWQQLHASRCLGWSMQCAVVLRQHIASLPRKLDVSCASIYPVMTAFNIRRYTSWTSSTCSLSPVDPGPHRMNRACFPPAVCSACCPAGR